MQDIIMDVAKELGIENHLSIKEFADSIEPLVTIAYSAKAVQARIRADTLLNRERLKMVLSELAQLAQRG